MPCAGFRFEFSARFADAPVGTNDGTDWQKQECRSAAGADAIACRAVTLAHPVRRLAAMLVDGLCWGVVTAPILLASELSPQAGQSPWPFAAFAVGTWLIFMALLAYFDGRRGATPGKRLLGMRVVDKATGSLIGLRRAAIRRMVWAVGGWCLYLGWLWSLFDSDRQSWHDKAARSLVIRTL